MLTICVNHAYIGTQNTHVNYHRSEFCFVHFIIKISKHYSRVDSLLNAQICRYVTELLRDAISDRSVVKLGAALGQAQSIRLANSRVSEARAVMLERMQEEQERIRLQASSSSSPAGVWKAVGDEDDAHDRCVCVRVCACASMNVDGSVLQQ